MVAQSPTESRISAVHKYHFVGHPVGDCNLFNFIKFVNKKIAGKFC
jgi:hypothetical protein